MKKTPTIRRATVEELNAIVNRDDVMPHLGGVAGVTRDIREIEFWERMIPLTAGDGAMLFLPVEPGIYRLDLLFVPRHRTNMEHARAMISHVFTAWNANGVYGYTPRQNVMACRFVEKLPAKLVDTASDGFYNVYATNRRDWPWLTNREQNPN